MASSYWSRRDSPAPPRPDDALLFDLLADWAPDEKMRNRILVENAAVLYGSPSEA
jgi:predicted TIM-barrel fold metal-dependent hydrolase